MAFACGLVTIAPAVSASGAWSSAPERQYIVHRDRPSAHNSEAARDLSCQVCAGVIDSELVCAVVVDSELIFEVWSVLCRHGNHKSAMHLFVDTRLLVVCWCILWCGVWIGVLYIIVFQTVSFC